MQEKYRRQTISVIRISINRFINLLTNVKLSNIAKHQHAFIFAFEQDLNLNSLDVRVENDNNST
jgi:hypothetical protein